MKKFTIVLLVASFLVVSSASGARADREIAVLTPYLSSVTTKTLIDSVTSRSRDRGWDVTVIDTEGDFDKLANRYEDVIARGVDAIVMGMGDPRQLKTQIREAAEAGIPVFGGDAGYIPAMKVNVTSNNYVLAAQNTSYLLNRVQDPRVVKLYHSAHPGVRKREVIFDAIVASRENVEVVAEHFVQVPGPIEDARNAMESILLSHPDVNAVWAAWDEPAIGAALAIRAAGKQDRISVVGIDGNAQALDMIQKGSSIKATVKQDFRAMGRILVREMNRVFQGNDVTDKIIYAPSHLVTAGNVETFLK